MYVGKGTPTENIFVLDDAKYAVTNFIKSGKFVAKT